MSSLKRKVAELEGEITELHGVGKRRTAAHADLQAQLERSRAEVERLKHMLSRACGEIFGGVVVRPFMIEVLREFHIASLAESKEGE
jgi:hypothetical protein